MLEWPWLTARAARTPGREALVEARRAWSFAELEARAGRRAGALAAAGVAAGDRVAGLLRSGSLAIETLHALDRLGAVWVPLNTRLTARELAFQLDDVGASLLLHDPDHAAVARDARALARPISMLALEEGRLDAEAAPAAEPRAPDDPFVVIYTSGTTGHPKGACLTRRNFWASATAAALHGGVVPGERWLACLPLFHVGGLSILLRSAIAGTSVVVHPRFDAGEVSRALDDDAIAGVSLTATLLQRILAAREGRPAPPALRCVLLGGAACPPALAAEAQAAGFPIRRTYGLTEAASQVATQLADAPPEAGATPLPGTTLRIVTEAGDDAHTDEVGEILVRGDTVMRGYVNAPEATARTLAGGWLHTGDLGRIAKDGTLHVVDRRSDLIVSGGENVYPAEIEAALLEHPAVAEVGVRGVADAEFGARPVAWWVAASGAEPIDAKTLRRHCRARLAGYKIPIAFPRVDALPRDANGKLRRRELPDTRPDPSGA